jgi:dTDP-4-dehydrorhamnose reductase
VKILILGVSGMLGNAMLRVMTETGVHDVCGTTRSSSALSHFNPKLASCVMTGLDVEQFDVLVSVFEKFRPDVVVNCIGLVKQLTAAEDPLQALAINSIFPHRLARLCSLIGARLVHVSTDCVFSGNRGNYCESDFPDANDLYGRSKLLGEVAYSHTITLRTSIIGPQLSGAHGLVAWFLAQDQRIKGYRRAIFSGLPTVELSRIVRDVVLPNPDLSGLFHVAAKPINKYELLKVLALAYAKEIEIEPDDRLVIDRSLNEDRFRAATGYVAAPWPDLIARMRSFH